MDIRLQNLQQHLLYGCFFIAACAAGLTLATTLEWQDQWSWRLPMAVGGATLVHYNLHYLFQKTTGLETDRMRWSRLHKKSQYGYVLLGLVCMIPYLRDLNLDQIRLWVPVILLGITYSFPIMPFSISRWKEQGLLKWLLLSLTWTLVTAYIPLAEQSVPLSDSWILMILRLELMLALCWLFDMRDLQLDRAYGVYTLPVQLGWTKAKKWAYGWTFLYLGTVLFLIAFMPNWMPIAHIGTALVLGLTCFLTTQKSSDLFYLGWVDGLMLWHLGFVILVHLGSKGGHFW